MNGLTADAATYVVHTASVQKTTLELVCEFADIGIQTVFRQKRNVVALVFYPRYIESAGLIEKHFECADVDQHALPALFFSAFKSNIVSGNNLSA